MPLLRTSLLATLDNVSREGVRRTRRRFLATILVPSSRPRRKDHQIVPALQPVRFALGQFSGTVTSGTGASTAIITAIAATATGVAAVAAGGAAAATDGAVSVAGAG